MSKLFEQFMKEGIIIHLQDTEKHDYISFLKHTWQDNLDASKFNLIKFPRWSIIAGYYAMHDMAKLFLAKEFNLKITQRVHTATTLALENVLKDKEQKKRLIELLKQAENCYSETELHRYLKIAKKEREKVQYYTGSKTDIRNYQFRASYLLENIALPFIETLEEMMR